MLLSFDRIDRKLKSYSLLELINIFSNNTIDNAVEKVSLKPFRNISMNFFLNIFNSVNNIR